MSKFILIKTTNNRHKKNGLDPYFFVKFANTQLSYRYYRQNSIQKYKMSHIQNEEDNESWDLVLEPKNKWYSLRLLELFRFKDLLMLFVRRDFVAVYKQTVLGPIWFFVQPIITALTFSVIFGRMANISTGGICHNYCFICAALPYDTFSDTLLKIADTFTANANIFGKVSSRE